jgi:NhaP-type Na+/H+ or K+/H+ antiporter/mannitol/fructose-specific phosphotransferase system IIA component (Ntr-type)
MGHTSPLLTLATAACVGVVLFVVSARLKIPPIALLLPGGVLVGPEMLGLIEPMALGGGLQTVVGIAVAVILFEGGLALDLDGYRKAPAVIGRMLTVGVVLSWLGTACALWLLLDLPPLIALVGGSLVVVTGPTVISPILRRVGVRARLAHVLYWEGVLIDFVGVFLTVLCFEWVTVSGDVGVSAPLGYFLLRVLVGAAVGAVTGLVLDLVLRSGWVGLEHVNILVLTFAMLAFGGANAVLAEAGILAVIVAGMWLAIRRPPQIKQLHHFKLELTELSIGLVFVLLSANLKLGAFAELGWPGVMVIGVVVLVLRPLNVLVATWGQGFSKREKAFLSWVAPRGIVAAAMASVFAGELVKQGHTEARVLETFTFAVIGVTVLLQGLSASSVARWLRLEKPPRDRWLLVGEPLVVGAIGEALDAAGVPVVLCVEPGESTEAGRLIEMVEADGLEPELLNDPRLMDVGHVLALTPNPHLNQLVCQMWGEVLSPRACARWAPGGATRSGDAAPAGLVVWPKFGPSELGPALANHSQVLEVIEIGPLAHARFGPHMRPLAWVEGRAVHLLPECDLPASAEQVLVLRDRVEGLAGLVQEAFVLAEPLKSLRVAIERLLRLGGPSDHDLDEVVAGILHRERDLPTTMGMGVVMPHTYLEGLKQPRCLMARLSPPIEGETPDGVPIDLVFLMLSPKGRPELHLQAMAGLARLIYDARFVERLRSMPTAEGMLRLIRDRE